MPQRTSSAPSLIEQQKTAVSVSGWPERFKVIADTDSFFDDRHSNPAN
jgi:hypothetical protein